MILLLPRNLHEDARIVAPGDCMPRIVWGIALAWAIVARVGFAQVPPPPPPVAPSEDMPPPVASDDAPEPVPAPTRTAPQLPKTVTKRLPVDGEKAMAARQYELAVHALAPGRTLALALEHTGRMDAAGKQWQLLGKTATGELGMAMVRRVNALAETEIGLAALAAGKAAEAVKRLRSASVELMAQLPLGLPLTGSLLQTLAFAEHAAGHAKEAKAALARLAAAGSQAQAARAQALAKAGSWPRQERLLGDGELEKPIGVALLPNGGFVVAADVQFEGAGHKLRLWTLDATGRQQKLLTWGGGGEDIPVALATSATGGVFVAGRSLTQGSQKAWLTAFEGSKPTLYSVLPAQEARALMVLAKDAVALAGTHDQRAWLGIVQQGVTESAVAFGPKGCVGTGVAALASGSLAVVARCSQNAVVTAVNAGGPPRWSAELPSQGDCALANSGKQLLVVCPNAVASYDAATGKRKTLIALTGMTPLPTTFLATLGAGRIGALGAHEATLLTWDARGKPGPRLKLPQFEGEHAVAFTRAGSDLVFVSEFAGDVVWRRLSAK